ncbi:hypothetical protein KM043_012964 [Ampulex compressa]|nr:hypothetical protein KM043_012964 [Ampulex compressa]
MWRMAAVRACLHLPSNFLRSRHATNVRMRSIPKKNHQPYWCVVSLSSVISKISKQIVHHDGFHEIWSRVVAQYVRRQLQYWRRWWRHCKLKYPSLSIGGA